MLQAIMFQQQQQPMLLCSKVGIVITYKNNEGTNTLNTDIVAEVSADGGSNYSTVTLALQQELFLQEFYKQ